MKRLSLILILLTTSSAWAENYLCISDEAAGFRVENEEYKATIFAGGDKYIVSANNRTVTPFGYEAPMFNNCEDHDNRIYCTGFGTFFLHKKKLRFMRSIQRTDTHMPPMRISHISQSVPAQNSEHQKSVLRAPRGIGSFLMRGGICCQSLQENVLFIS